MKGKLSPELTGKVAVYLDKHPESSLGSVVHGIGLLGTEEDVYSALKSLNYLKGRKLLTFGFKSWAGEYIQHYSLVERAYGVSEEYIHDIVEESLQRREEWKKFAGPLENMRIISST